MCKSGHFKGAARVMLAERCAVEAFATARILVDGGNNVQKVFVKFECSLSWPGKINSHAS